MTTERLGLSDNYSHYFDKFGNKYFDSIAWYAIPFIRQIQTVDGRMADSSDGQLFRDLADSLGLAKSLSICSVVSVVILLSPFPCILLSIIQLLNFTFLGRDRKERTILRCTQSISTI